MSSVIDRLASLAAGAEPPALDDSAATRMIDRALAPLARPAPATRVVWIPAAIAIGLAAAVIAWTLQPSRPPSAPELSRITLPTGDRVVGLAGAQFDVERLEPTDRRLRLSHGEILVDVAHVANGQRFAIATAQLVATAKGTVFSVEADDAGSRVEVYEGVVDVEQDGIHHALAAGEAWTSATHAIAAGEPPSALAGDVTEALRRRTRAAAVPAPTAPIEPVPAAPVAVTPPPADSVPAPVAVTQGPADPVPAPAAVTPAPAASAVEPVLGALVEPAPEPTIDQLLVRARTQLAAKQLADALATAQLAAARGATRGPWRLVTADALRGLGRLAEAAAAFDRAAEELTGADAIDAGYTAAYLRFHDLTDPAGALVSLDSARVDGQGSVLEERGLALHVQILVALGRRDDARPIAARYLASFPHGELRASMLALAK